MVDILILIGPPCAGKTTFAELEQKYNYSYILSRDILREKFFGKNYKQCPTGEKFITEAFNKRLKTALAVGKKVILDNTHCKEKYIDDILLNYGEYRIGIKYFDVSLPVAYFRNTKRYLQTGKFIPFKVIRNMHSNFNKINRKKYEHLLM